MTERKPRDESWEAWANRKLEEALEAGAFDHPEGQGEPLPGIEGPYDPLWWVRRKIEEEGLNVLPPSLSARREAERALEAAFRLADERQFLAALDAVNAFIRRANAVSVWGPRRRLCARWCLRGRWRSGARPCGAGSPGPKPATA